jgi:hypothetical protein
VKKHAVYTLFLAMTQSLLSEAVSGFVLGILAVVCYLQSKKDRLTQPVFSMENRLLSGSRERKLLYLKIQPFVVGCKSITVID